MFLKMSDQNFKKVFFILCVIIFILSVMLDVSIYSKKLKKQKIEKQEKYIEQAEELSKILEEMITQINNASIISNTEKNRKDKESEIQSYLKSNFENFDLEKIQINDELKLYLIYICKEYNINPKKAITIMFLESNFDELAESETNDKGLMQINECNFNWLAETLKTENNPLDPKINILWGVYMIYCSEQEAKNLGYDKKELLEASLSIYNYGINGFKEYGLNESYINFYNKKYNELLNN